MDTPFTGSMPLSMPLLLLLGKATIILLMAVAVTRTMQRASAGARHLVWLVALATLVLVPVMTAWGPIRVAVLPGAERGAGREQATDAVLGAPPAVEGGEVPTSGPAAAPSLAAPPRPSFLVPSLSPSQLLLAAWSLVALAIIASLAWSGLAVRRIVRNASPLEHDSWRTPLYEVADRMGLEDAPRLVRSDEARMPFACGILTPTIVLPADCEAWSLDRRRAVLLHELAHVRRHDLVGHTLGRLVCAAYWFHPLAWTAARQLRAESERACDDLALSCGTRATDYAEHLLDIVTSVRKDATPSVALAMARRKEFEGRMLAILDPELRRSAPSRRQSAALTGALALVALTVGAISPVARTVEAAQPPAGAAMPAAPRSAAALLPGAPAPVAAVETARGDTGRTVANAADTSELDEIVRESTNEVVSAVTGTVLGEMIGRTVATASADAIAAVSASAGRFAGEVATNTVRNTMRNLAMGAEGQSSDERVALLAKVLRSDTSASLRRVAAWGLHEHASDAAAATALAGALKGDGDARVREMAAWALGDGSGRNGAAIEALTVALRTDADEKVRATSAWALGELGDRGSVDALAAALSSPSATVRTRALWAIGNIEPREAPRAVVAALRDPDTRTRRLAAWALYQIADPSALGPLQDALKAEQDKDVQLAEIRAIGALGERSVDALKALIESPDPRMRSMAVHALAGRDASGPWPWPWPEPRPHP